MGLLDALFGTKKKVLPLSVRDLPAFKKQVLKSDLPVIVDVWSDTCAPCKQLEPVLIDVATRYEGRVRVAEVHTSSDPRLLMSLDVRSTPTVLIFSKGKELGRQSGFRSREWFDQMIETEFPQG
jgi:thioredoxin-like negative regulator of GroEL